MAQHIRFTHSESDRTQDEQIGCGGEAIDGSATGYAPRSAIGSAQPVSQTGQIRTPNSQTGQNRTGPNGTKTNGTGQNGTRPNRTRPNRTGPTGTTGQNGTSARVRPEHDSRGRGNRSVTGSGYPVTWSESRHAERARPVTGFENRCGTRPSGLHHRERARRVTFRPRKVTQVAPRDTAFAPRDAAFAPCDVHRAM